MNYKRQLNTNFRLTVKMERWLNKVAVVTGASSGIGAAVVKELLVSGLIVVGLARRKDRIVEIGNGLSKEQQSKLHAIKCDVSKEEDVVKAFDWVEKNLGGTDILVNNAGLMQFGTTTDKEKTPIIRETIDVNVMGFVYCAREAFNSMKKRNFDGHIIVVNSVVGHYVPQMPPGMPSINVYPASKFAVTAMVETYRQEFSNAGTKVKITSISPGAVNTELVPETVKAYFIEKKIPVMQPEDISNAIKYAISTPPHVQIHELIIRPL